MGPKHGPCLLEHSSQGFTPSWQQQLPCCSAQALVQELRHMALLQAFITLLLLARAARGDDGSPAVLQMPTDAGVATLAAPVFTIYPSTNSRCGPGSDAGVSSHHCCVQSCEAYHV